MTAFRIYIPGDTTACALGADVVAELIAAGADGRGIGIELVRNGSGWNRWSKLRQSPDGLRLARCSRKTSPDCSSQDFPVRQIIGYRWGR